MTIDDLIAKMGSTKKIPVIIRHKFSGNKWTVSPSSALKAREKKSRFVSGSCTDTRGRRLQRALLLRNYE